MKCEERHQNIWHLPSATIHRDLNWRFKVERLLKVKKTYLVIVSVSCCLYFPSPVETLCIQAYFQYIVLRVAPNFVQRLGNMQKEQTIITLFHNGMASFQILLAI